MINVASRSNWTGTTEAKAMHEAGHAVVGVKLGRTIKTVTLKSPATQLPRAEFEDTYQLPAHKQNPTPEEKELLEQYIRQAIAGRAAELQIFGPTHTPGDQDDMGVIRSLADHAYPEGESRKQWQTQAMTKGSLDARKCRDAIDELADELLAKGDRSHADVVRIMNKYGLL